VETGKFLKVLVKKSEGIQACLRPSDPFNDFGRIAVKPSSVFFCLGLGIP